jgi:hypothetical protein
VIVLNCTVKKAKIFNRTTAAEECDATPAS